MRKATTLLLLLFLCLTRVSAKLEDGIVFKSYNVLAEERTSLCVPAGHNSWISFSDSISVSFSVKIDLNVGRFGYICRMLLDDYQPLDIVLSPKGTETIVCATANHQSAVDVFEDDQDLGQWRDIYVRAFRDGESIVFTTNGKEVLRAQNPQRRHRLRMVFGKVDIPGFITSDVAPMKLADLQIRKDSGKVASWMLSAPEDLRPKGGISIQAVNHLFSRDLNSHWATVLSTDVPSVTYSCFSADYNKVFFISQGQILVFDIPSLREQRITYTTDIKNSFVLDQFQVLEDGTLVLADAPTGQFVRFDSAKGDWEKESGRTRMSTHLHHNSVLVGGKYYQMFGYGQHRYSNTVWIWDPKTFGMEERELSQASPRYLAGAAEHDGKVYVLGGKGNAFGHQELGVHLYDALLEIDPVSLSATTLWANPLLQEYTPAQDLLFLEDGIYALLYNPEVHDSALRLTRFDPQSGKEEFLSEAIPYPFLDITSQARLAFNGETDSFISVLCYQDADGQNKVEVNLLANPVIPARKEESRTGIPLWVYLVLAVLAAAALAVWLFRVFSRGRRQDDVDLLPEAPSQPQVAGVYFLGGLHVRDRDGRDITSGFSPTLMQFLTILVLYTADKGGVSNARLKSILWPDKSDDSFNNNKGVYLRKLRDALEQVGHVTIVQDGGVWKIEEGTQLFDYIVAKSRIMQGDTAQVLRVASWGSLLPEYEFDWLDPFKASYTDTVLSKLSSIASSGVSPEVSLRIADCRLLFDSLDEDAIALKCQSLVSLGRAGTAKAVFERFKGDYLRIMGEEFSKDFSVFVKK